jgi:hypothetical protein
MAAHRGFGEKRGLTSMARDAAELLWQFEERPDRYDWHVDALIEEGTITRRDIQTLRRLRVGSPIAVAM